MREASQLLAEQIVQAVDQSSSVWTNCQELGSKAVWSCWIPEDDCNGISTSCCRPLWEEPWAPYPSDELKEGRSSLVAYSGSTDHQLLSNSLPLYCIAD